jgi:hypothetical protein
MAKPAGKVEVGLHGQGEVDPGEAGDAVQGVGVRGQVGGAAQHLVEDVPDSADAVHGGVGHPVGMFVDLVQQRVQIRAECTGSR